MAAFARWEAPLIAGLSRTQEVGELRPDTDVPPGLLGLAIGLHCEERLYALSLTARW